jgi:hypothetical protein
MKIKLTKEHGLLTATGIGVAVFLGFWGIIFAVGGIAVLLDLACFLECS